MPQILMNTKLFEFFIANLQLRGNVAHYRLPGHIYRGEGNPLGRGTGLDWFDGKGFLVNYGGTVEIND
jgi:hypothetical protein